MKICVTLSGKFIAEGERRLTRYEILRINTQTRITWGAEANGPVKCGSESLTTSSRWSNGWAEDEVSNCCRLEQSHLVFTPWPVASRLTQPGYRYEHPVLFPELGPHVDARHFCRTLRTLSARDPVWSGSHSSKWIVSFAHQRNSWPLVGNFDRAKSSPSNR